jgi:hypothetical protein
VSFGREKTIPQAILTERAPLLKRIIARLIGFDGAYHRFTGKVTIGKFERDVPVEAFRRSRHLGTDVFRKDTTSGRKDLKFLQFSDAAMSDRFSIWRFDTAIRLAFRRTPRQIGLDARGGLVPWALE